jgi:gluconolactonase
VYRVDKGSRKVTKVASGMAFPNGVAFSADAKALYIAESHTFRILKAAVKPDGSLEKPELFCQMPTDHVPDGMNFDQAGNLYVGTVGPGLVTIIAPDGKIAKTITVPGTDVTNVEFGGKGLKTLYITEAQKGILYSMEVAVGGLPLFRAPNNEVK